MKSTKKEGKQNIYPKLQVAINGNIFLMHEATKGTCVHSHCGDFLGQPIVNLDQYSLTDFRGSITLEN